MKRMYLFQGVIVVCLISLIHNMLINPSISRASLTLTDDKITTSANVKNDVLYKEIKSYANEHEVKPIDAKVDRVWKAIPGYNGLQVNVEASYKKMKTAHEFDVSRLVYKETSPQVHLNDLPPLPIYKGNPEKPMVAFLINVAWGNEYIPKILQTLNKHKVKATFFFDGSWVKKNPELAEMINNEKHEIGNHAYSHPDLNQKSQYETMIELKKTNDVIQQTLGIKPKWFAPPSGSFNQGTVNVAHQLEMNTILWTVDTVDWRNPATMEMVSRIIPKVDSGTMILMHPTKPVAEGLEKMIVDIEKKGFRLGTVTEILSENRVPKNPL